MRTFEDHLKELLEKIDVVRLVSPKTAGKAEALKQECGKIERLISQILNIVRAGEKAADQITYLDSTIRGEQLGEKIYDASFVELSQNHVPVSCLASIVDYVHARVQKHAETGTYDQAYLDGDRKLPEFPLTVGKLTSKQPELTTLFMKYLKEVALDTTLDKLPELYAEFQDIILNGILKAGDYAGILYVRGREADWNQIRSLYHEKAEREWIGIFEQMETKYPDRNLPLLAELYTKQNKKE